MGFKFHIHKPYEALVLMTMGFQIQVVSGWGHVFYISFRILIMEL